MKRVLMMCLAAGTIGVTACGGRPATPAPTGAEARLTAEGDAWQKVFYDFVPQAAREVGLHAWDGKLPDRSAAGIQRFLDETKARQAVIEAIPDGELTPRGRAEKAVLIGAMKEWRFDLETRREPWKNPMHYTRALDVSGYISREYAPLGERVKGILGTCAEAERFLGEARANLEPKLARTFIDTALIQAKGQVSFLKDDVPKALAGLDAAERAPVDQCLEDLGEQVAGFVTFLEARRVDATDAFAMGETDFLAMLSSTQGVTMDVATLQKIAQEDLDRNLAAIAAEAAKLAPGKPVAEVVREAAGDHVAADSMLSEATAQATQARQFLIDQKIVSIPYPDVAEVKLTPAFMRWNSAFLDPAGAFESSPLPSFYYISPPDPSWPKAEQDAYLPPRADMLFTTVHEVWPGHFLHQLHLKANPSKVLKSFCTYTMVEGWAHYTEEMMFDAGLGGHDGKLHIGQLKEALLRNVRFLVAIGEHVQGMSVDEATQLFVDKAFADPATARQQAVRGTFDPMFLSYTLGKLAIKKMATDWRAKTGGSLQAFHDAFLGVGCAPLPTIRHQLMGDDSPIL